MGSTSHITRISFPGDAFSDGSRLWFLKQTPLTHLKALELENSDVSDADIAHIEGLPTLKELNLSGTRVTRVGVERLKKSLPNCTIHWSNFARDRQAANELLALGAKLAVEAGGRRWDVAATSEIPAFPFRITGIDLVGCKGVDASFMTRISQLDSLRSLVLSNSDISDGALAALKDCVSLEELNLEYTDVTPAGLKQLAALKQLRVLKLAGKNVGDDHAVVLAEFPNLETVCMRRSNVTDAGLRHLKALGRLKELRLNGSPLTGSGLVHLQELSQLEQLDLGTTRVSDETVKHLLELNQLRRLWLYDGGISDKSLEVLTALPHLAGLELWFTRVTAEGIAKFKSARPGCNVNWVSLEVDRAAAKWVLEHGGALIEVDPILWTTKGVQ